MLNVNANELAPEQCCRIPRKLVSPGTLTLKTTFTRIFCDTQDAVNGKNLPGRCCDIALKNGELMIKPSARLFRQGTAGKLEFEFLFLAERDNYVMLHFSLLR